MNDSLQLNYYLFVSPAQSSGLRTGMCIKTKLTK